MGPSSNFQQVKYTRTWSWNVFSAENYRILFSFRLSWLCTIKRLFETISDDQDATLQSPERKSGERSNNQGSKRGKNPSLRGKWENAISGKQLDSVRKETHVVSVMIPNLETEARRDEKDNRPLLHQKRRHKLTERYPQKV